MTDDRLTVARVREWKRLGTTATFFRAHCIETADLILAQSDLLRRMGERIKALRQPGCKDTDCTYCNMIRALLDELDKLEGATNDGGGE